MNSNYFKCTLTPLLLFLQAITMTITAQQNSMGDAPQFKGMTLSENNGILSKIKTNAKDLIKKDPGLFHSRPTAGKQYRLNGQPEITENSSSYEYHDHPHGRGISIPLSAATDDMGNTYITGATSNENSPEANYVAIKVDSDGNQEWETILPGAQFAYETGVVSGIDADGNFITSGLHWNGSDVDMKTVKFNAATGDIIWESIFDNNYAGLDIPTAMHIDQDGNTVVVGITYANNAINYLTLFYDINGALVWSAMDTTSHTNTWNEPTAVTTDTAGNVFVTGVGALHDSGQGYWSGYKTLKYDDLGNLLWQETYLFERLMDETDPTSEMIFTDSMPQSVAVDTSGNTYITGTFDLFGHTRIGTIKYNASGNEEWIDTFRAGIDNTKITNGHDILFVDDNTIYVGGRHREGWVDEGIVLLSYDSDGNRNWNEETLNSIQISISKLILDNNNLPVIAGLGYDLDTFDQRIRVFRYSDQGVLLNETSYFKPQSDTESIMGLVHLGLDLSDNVYLVMDNAYSATGQVFETVKMHLDSGHDNTDWELIYSNLFGSNTSMLSATRDNANNTYVTGHYGTILNNEYITNFVVTKYNEQGQVEWEQVFNELNGNETSGIMLKVNSQGEVIVILIPDPFGLTHTLRLKKYTAEGELVWETEKPVYNAYLNTFLLDENDAIIIAGSAKEEEVDPFASFFTIKFSSSGSEVWSHFTITDNPDDNRFEINAGTINAQGDIILAGASGFSTMFSSEVDLTVLKYSSSGSLEWMNKYPQSNFISAGWGVLTDGSDAIYTAGSQQSITNPTEHLLVLKLDNNGEEVWNTVYSQTNRLLRPYKIMKDSNGDLIATASSTYFVIGEPTNNRITTVKLNKEDGEIDWENDTNLDRFYADSYIDADDDVYVFNMTQSSAIPHRTGMRSEGELTKIAPDGTSGVETFMVPNLSLFFPVVITPLNNGTLLLAGDTSHETGFFGGYYFFESSHNPLSIQDHQQSVDKKGNWLGQNYPNPVLNTTEIPFYLTDAEPVKLNLYDNQGRFLFEIENATFPKGLNTVQVDRSGLIPGVYFYQIEAGNYKYARKLIVK